MAIIVTARTRQPASLPALNRGDPAASKLVAMFAPWAKTDAATGSSLTGWTGLDAIGAGVGGIGAIGAGSNYIIAPAGYGRWAGKSVWGLILTFRLRSTSQTDTYVIRQGIGGGEQASLIYGYASQQFELFANGYSGTDPRTGSQITVADTQVHTLAYVADGTRTRGFLDGRIVTDVAATTTFPSGGEPPTHFMAVNGTGHCAIEIYALGFWAGSVPTPGQVQSATRNPWQMFAPVRRPVVFFGPSAGAGTTVAVPVGAVSVAGYAPAVTATAHQTIGVPAGAVSLAGYAPTVSTSASQTISVPAGAVSLTGYAPTVFTTAVTTIAVPAGAVSLAGFAPSVSYTTHAYIDVPKGAVGLTGYAPTVLGGESGIWTPVTVDAATWTPQ